LSIKYNYHKTDMKKPQFSFSGTGIQTNCVAILKRHVKKGNLSLCNYNSSTI